MPDKRRYCTEAWRLYDIWVTLVDDEANDGEIQEAYKDLLDHRSECPECLGGEHANETN